MCSSTENGSGWQPTAVGLGVIGACLLAEAAVLRIGIDDLDEGYFVQQAARVLHGEVPYRDFQTLYTPGLVSLHALLFWALGGPYVLAPRVLALVARAALAIALYALTRPLVRRPAWAIAPSLFLLLGLDDAPERWEPHPGWLSTLFAVLAAWCLARGQGPGVRGQARGQGSGVRDQEQLPQSPRKPPGQPVALRWLVAAGVAAGIAYLFKQNTGAFMLAAILLWGVVDSPGRLRRVLVPLAAFVVVTLLWLGPLLVVLQGQVALLGGFVGAVNQAGLGSPPEPSIAIPLLCALGGLWLNRFSTDTRLRWYLLAGTALFETQYPRADTLHLAWSAPLLLVVGAVVLDRVRPVAVALGVVMSAFVLVWPLPATRVELIQQPLVAIEDVRFANGLQVPARTAADVQGVVRDVQQRTEPGEPIFVYPTSPLLYALAERPNPTQFDHLNPGAATPSQIEGVIADLEAQHVKLVVISDYWQAAWGPPGPNAPLEAWLDSRFTEVARYGAYRVLLASL